LNYAKGEEKLRQLNINESLLEVLDINRGRRTTWKSVRIHVVNISLYNFNYIISTFNYIP